MTLRFVVNGTPVDAEPRTTVAAALLNAGIVNFRQSVRGEPRAPLCAMGVCHECRVTIDGVAHQRSCLVEVRDGMAVETAIRAPRVAASRDADELAADVVVIGGGPAGIAAAVSAAERAVKVILIDEGNRAGGQIWRHRDNTTLTPEAQRWLLRLERTSTRIINAATVSFIQREDERFIVAAEQALQPLMIRSKALVLATGARELFLPFPGSTLPGVLGVGALQALLKSGLNVRGARIMIAGTGPLLMPVAAAAARAGAKLLLVAEQAPLRSVARFATGLWRHPSSLVQAAQYRAAFRATPYTMNTWVTSAVGDDRVRSAEFTDGVNARTLECDYLAVAHGLIPNAELARHLGCATLEGAVLVDEYQNTNVSNVYCAGEVTGVAGMDLAIVEGMIAGLSASGAPAAAQAHMPLARSLRAMALRMTQAFALRDELRGLARPDAIVCRCEDVPMSAIRPGWTMRQAKLYSRAGMGACQGRTCGAALEFLAAASPDSVRMPVQPAQLTTLTAASAAVHNDLGERHDG